MADMDKSSLFKALGNMLGATVEDATYSSEVLQGGTVGDVVKLAGDAKTGNTSHPFSLVVKTQHKWDRHGDPECWRREYEIYKNGLTNELPKTLKLPQCYLLETGDDFTRIWMETIAGRTGNKQLHADELALAAEKLGELQAGFHLSGRRDLPYLRNYPAIQSSFDLWWNRMKKPLSEKMDGFPDELRHALNDYAARTETVLASLDVLPLTICQGDVHHDNLIFKDTPNATELYLIDWDCAGYGRMGEDAIDLIMEAFVYSSRAIVLLPAFRQQILAGYCKGAKAGGVDFMMDHTLVRDMFALAWGFRIADLYLYYHEEHQKRRCVEILQVMLEGDYL